MTRTVNAIVPYFCQMNAGFRFLMTLERFCVIIGFM